MSHVFCPDTPPLNLTRKYGNLKTCWFRIPKLKYIWNTFFSHYHHLNYSPTTSQCVQQSCPVPYFKQVIWLLCQGKILLLPGLPDSMRYLKHIAQWGCREIHIGIKMQQNGLTTFRISKFFPRTCRPFCRL